MNINLYYIAGFFDGEGCFSISIKKRGKLRPYIEFSPCFRVAQKAIPNRITLLEDMQSSLGIGSVYFSNKGNKKALVSWQSTKWKDTLEFTELIGPFLKIKKEQANLMAEALNILNNYNESNKAKGLPTRTKEEAQKLVEISLRLNHGESAQAQIRKKEKEKFYKELIDKVYTYRPINPIRKGGMPQKYSDEDLLAEVKRIETEGYSWKKDRNWKELARYRFGSWEKAVSLI